MKTKYNAHKAIYMHVKIKMKVQLKFANAPIRYSINVNFRISFMSHSPASTCSVYTHTRSQFLACT